jgi:mono/diheme cytochrome c family protein
MTGSRHGDGAAHRRGVTRTRAPAGLLLLALASAALACGREAPAPAPQIEAAPAPAEALVLDPGAAPEEVGRRVYERFECAGCHESAAVPGLIVTPLRELAARYDRDALAAYLAAPVSPMPRFELSQDERRALAAYLLARFGGAAGAGPATGLP